MQPQPYVRFSPPVTLCLTLPSATRPRVAAPTATQDAWLEFDALPLHVHIDALARTITAYLAPIPQGLALYGDGDFPAACADSMEDHAAQVLRLLGADHAAALQALIDGGDIPAAPPRIPREVAHWRIAHILSRMGKLAMVEAMISDLPDEARSIAESAWTGKSALALQSPLVLMACQWLGFSLADRDALFLAAAAIPA